METVLPGLDLIHPSRAWLYRVLNEGMCGMEGWAEQHRCSLLSTALREMWALRWSRISSQECTECSIRWSRNSGQVSSFIHPVLVEAPLAPGGAPIMKSPLNLTLGKTNMGGMAFPAAFTAHTTSTSSRLSADVIEPTRFFPFSVTTWIK